MADVTAWPRASEDLTTMVAMTQMSTPSPQPSASTPIRVGPHELSVVGVVAVSRTAACTRYAKDADRAPQMAARVDLLRMSAWEVSSFDRVVALASAHGIDAAGAAERFTDVLGDLDERLRPLDWAERLVKTYIAFGLLIDFGMALSDSLAEPLRSGLIDELGQDPISSYAIAELEASIAADSQLAARLGLWGRRVVGEEIGTFQRLLGQFPELLGSVAPEQFHAVLSQGAVSRMKGLGLRV
ncbi:tRNA 2-methylthio-N6-isopentenyl adenosine(37) hydroxylase MiaE-like protein [Actinomyces naeslundii]|nr:tRNA 2-methylthio-N6-isopentenyl adenosine(37) hydroxylase MiaE-like protein [Actinomyces naeslundii]OMG11834.1 tRNA 2-methylthio-N6-isopentenyl adenosine(37) hydroxylase MiaE-like protein [Actinomyces naeslundii]OMG18341.1 tRNA 2-methylthio-N6-isopentenyl adenosine(37) hydroxylase MiaE-like protein [Actinomyces naeslundii]OMG23155.1 tRNA 2-methylthio-N6-isopentenyl adenosine(37) hydroxylase MiaE-like protein [Actinomyces naeslundii]OMG35229.1 tRNA 2-methylthio-N6-isopentenyl adenosine(37) h